MSNKKENKPKIRFPEFTDDWRHGQLKDFASFMTGNGLSRNDITDKGEQECILYGHLYTDYGMIADKVFFKTNTKINSPVYSEYGDVLIPASDTTPTGLARATSIEKKGCLLGGGINIVRPNKMVDGSCLSLAINSNKKELLRLIKGTTVRHLNNSDIQNIYIFLPSTLSEQDKIKTLFKILDKNIFINQHKLEILKNIKKGFLQKLFPKKDEINPELRFPGFTDDWKEGTLGSFACISTGKLDANAMKEDGKYDFYTSGIKKYKIDSFAFEGPAITIAGNGATVGYMHLADGKFNAYQRTYVLLDFLADRKFLFYEIGIKLPQKIRKEARSGNIPYIVMDMLTDLKVNNPNNEEQKKIGLFLESLETFITLYQQKLEILQKIKKGLLQQMFV